MFNNSSEKCQLSRGETGFALLEVMIAVIIVSVGLFGLLASTTFGSRGATEAVERTEAASIASSTLAKIRSASGSFAQWNGLDIVSASALAPSGLELAFSNLKEEAMFALKPTELLIDVLTPNTTSVCAALPCQVTVTVRWNSAASQPRSFVLSGWLGVQ
jgi:type II secretory pathway pseudopilin PulG